MGFYIPYALVFIILAGESWTFNRRTNATRKDAFSFQVTTSCFFLGYMAAFWLRRQPPSLGFWAVPAGAVLALCGTALRAYSMRVLGKYFTRIVRVSPDQKVIEVGPYRFIRHPCYSGALMACLGVGLSLRSLLSLACLMILPAIGVAYRVAIEEKALRETLGDPYRSYMRRTKRFIPFIF